jgi:prophage antirepressor-like protein
MDILRAFVFNNKEYNITILWENNEPLFKASEIANLLKISNIHSSILNYDDDEKIIRNQETNSGNQDIIFLTEFGLYKLLMNSRKSEAKPFQKWLCKVIKNIRETGKYELQKNLEDKELALKHEAEKMKKIIDLNQSNSLVEAFKDRYLVYIAKIKDENNKILIKIGSTKEIQNRIKTFN